MPYQYGDPNNAAIGQAINSIGQLFGTLTDPRVKADAARYRADMEMMPLKRQGLEADIALSRERALTEGAQRGLYSAQTAETTARTGFRNKLGSAADAFAAPPQAPDLESFVTGFEGFNPNPYNDGAQVSIGFGTKAPAGLATAPMTRDQAMAALRAELNSSGSRIDGAAQQFGVQLTPQQRNALISFDYNTGKGVDMLSRFGGNFTSMADVMSQYTKGREGGVPGGAKVDLPGLQRRRQAETQMLLGRGGQPVDPRSLAILAEAASTSPNSAALMQSLARGEALNGVPSEQRARELALAQGMMPSLTDAFLPQTQQNLIAQKAQGDNLNTVLKEAASAAFGGGSGTRSPLTPNAIFDNAKNASAVVDQVFQIPRNEAGALQGDPQAVAQRDALSKLTSHYMSQGQDPLTARDQAATELFGSANFSDPAHFQQPSGGFLGMGSAPFRALRFNADALRNIQNTPQAGNQAALSVLSQLFGGGNPQAQAPQAPPPQTGITPEVRSGAAAEIARRQQARKADPRQERLQQIEHAGQRNQPPARRIAGDAYRSLIQPGVDMATMTSDELSGAVNKSATDAVNYFNNNSPIADIFSSIFGSGLTDQQKMEAEYLRRKLLRENSGQ